MLLLWNTSLASQLAQLQTQMAAAQLGGEEGVDALLDGPEAAQDAKGRQRVKGKSERASELELGEEEPSFRRCSLALLRRVERLHDK